MLKIKRDINKRDFKFVDLNILPNLNDFHSLEVVDRVKFLITVRKFNAQGQALSNKPKKN